MENYSRYFLSQLFGKGQGNVELERATGTVAIRFHASDVTCRYRFDPRDLVDRSGSFPYLPEFALRCGIAHIHWVARRGKKNTLFAKEQPLVSVRPWIGDLSECSNHLVSAPSAFPSFEERRLDEKTAIKIYAGRKLMAEQGMRVARAYLEDHGVAKPAIHRVLSSRGRRRANKGD